MSVKYISNMFSYAEFAKVDLAKFTVAFYCVALTNVTFDIVFGIHILQEHNYLCYNIILQ